MHEQTKAHASVFRMLGNHLAYRIIAAIGRGKRRPMELAKELGASPSAIVNQLRLLKMSGVVQFSSSGERHKGRKVHYWLTDTAILGVCKQLEGVMGKIWRNVSRA